MGHKLDKVGGKAKKSLSSLKLNKDKKNLDSVPEGRELGGLGNLNLDSHDIDSRFEIPPPDGVLISQYRGKHDSNNNGEACGAI